MPPDLASPANLRQITLFAGLSDTALAALAARVRVRRYRKGEVLFHRDDPGTSLFLLEGGRIKISTFSAEGKEAVSPYTGLATASASWLCSMARPVRPRPPPWSPRAC